MKKVITYGTYDLFHQGHYNLLKRAKALGDYLIVGVTSDVFDLNRGKLNVRDSLIRRIENVKKTGFADEIIVEEYMGQKIDDIKKYDIDIFTVGSDWRGHFDYLSEYCQVHYLERTKGVSSTDIRNNEAVNIGIIGAENIVRRFCDEAKYVSGLEIVGIHAEMDRIDFAQKLAVENELCVYKSLDDMLDKVDAVYVCDPPKTHYHYTKYALESGKHVICEFPFCLNVDEAKELFAIAESNQSILLHGLKTAYTPAFQRMISLAKTGMIGNIIAVDASFTQVLGSNLSTQVRVSSGGSVNALGEYPLLAFIKLLGSNFKKVAFFSRFNHDYNVDGYTRFYLQYENAMATATVAIEAKSEGDMTITGTKGYLYIPAPWWKTEYFEVRFEDINKNMKYFYKFQGEGLRYELAEFVKCILLGQQSFCLTKEETLAMVNVLDGFNNRKNVSVF